MPFNSRKLAWWIALVALLLSLPGSTIRAAVAATTATTAPAASPILQDLQNFRQTGSVLYVAAHPDDENTQLITYLARGRHYRTAYLSLTRGDGGQNVLGPEFGEQLGVIRTRELLAARGIDGGRQFFTRALDFGFSKTPEETLRIWDRQQVLADIVRVIRTFRPDVVITRFSPDTGGGTHGHHTSSAILAVEAFKVCGDPKAFPDQLKSLAPWQPKRILLNGRGGGTVVLDIGGNDPVSDESFGKLAGRSRAMHKSQGFGNFTGGGGGGGSGVRADFTLLGGEPATRDILDGVDTTWARVPGGGAEIGSLADDVIAHFDPEHPADSVPALLKLHERLAALSDDVIITEKRKLLDRIVGACLGLTVQTIIAQAEVVPGEALKMRHTVNVHADTPVRWTAVRYPVTATQSDGAELKPDQPATRDAMQTLPANTPLTQPYWLREDGTAGMARVDDAELIGRPENPPACPIEFVFEISGQTLVLPDEPVAMERDAKKMQTPTPRRMEVIPPVALSFASPVELFAAGASHPVVVEVVASRADASGTLKLESPQGWKIEPPAQPFALSTVGERAKLTFTVTAPSQPPQPAQPASATLAARAQVGGATFDNQRIEIRYDHIPPILLQPHARLKAVCLDLAKRGKSIGYIPGAGDSVAPCLTQMGYEVTQLDGADLTPEKLKALDAVVIGVRAFNVRTDLAEHMPALFDYVKAGGNVVEQYNRPEGLKTNKFAPFDLRLSGDRVTDEQAAVTFLAPDHPTLNTPNKITPADFEGWVQERGIYFPSQWDEHWTPILACNDPGEGAKQGSLLVAQHGKGHFVYTGLVFFRQLPAGVPGAYRLFSNLVSLGK